MLKKFALTVLLTTLASLLHAQISASDNAADGAYQPNFNDWQNGDNGGFGFGPWSGLVDQYVGSSAANGDGSNNGATNIDTGGRAWALRGDGSTNGVGEAFRSFTSPLEVGWTFRLDFDNGFVDSPNAAGFGLQTSSGANLFEFYYVGGGTNSYKIAGSTIQTTTQGFTDDGMRTYLTLTGGNNFSFFIDFLGAGTVDQTITGTFASAGSFDRVRLFDTVNTGDPSGNAFYNNLEIAVPEPSTWAAGGMAVAGLLFLRRRRRA